jgi:hypothetical protein
MFKPGDHIILKDYYKRTEHEHWLNYWYGKPEKAIIISCKETSDKFRFYTMSCTSHVDKLELFDLASKIESEYILDLSIVRNDKINSILE